MADSIDLSEEIHKEKESGFLSEDGKLILLERTHLAWICTVDLLVLCVPWTILEKTPKFSNVPESTRKKVTRKTPLYLSETRDEFIRVFNSLKAGTYDSHEQRVKMEREYQVKMTWGDKFKGYVDGVGDILKFRKHWILGVALWPFFIMFILTLLGWAATLTNRLLK